MALLPPQLPLPPPPLPDALTDAMLMLNQDMHRVLNDTQMTDFDKALAHQQLLQRYRVLTDHWQERQDNNINIRARESAFPVATTTTFADAVTPPPPLSWKDQVLSSLPVMFHKRATSLLNHLDHVKDLAWTPAGEMIHRGRKIPGSHLVDLVEDMMRRQKTTEPVGWRQFASALKRSNVPKEFIARDARRRWMKTHSSYDVDTDQSPRSLVKHFMTTTKEQSPSSRSRWISLQQQQQQQQQQQ